MNIKKLLKNMTLREKLAQMTQLDGNFRIQTDIQLLTGPLHQMNISVEDAANSGTVLGAIGAELTRRIQDKHLAGDRHKIPVLFMLDVIHGFRTIFPIPLALGCTWEPELVEKTASVAACEASASGIHVNFSPMADLVRDARWGRVMESTGEDHTLNALFAAAFVRGYQGDSLKNPDSMAACIKHIAAYGAAEAGRDYSSVELGEYALREFYFPAYRQAIKAGAVMAMTSFNSLNGVPATGNTWLLRDVLRKEWGFDGVLISDWGAVHELVNHGVAEDGKEAAYKSIKAGVDIEMMTSDYLQFGEKLVQEGLIDETLIDEAVLRILQLKKDMGLFEDPYRSASPQREKEVQGCEEHRKLARETAARSMVLLKNNEDILPLSKQTKLAVIGPYGEAKHLLGGWSCVGREEETVSLKEGLAEKVAADQVVYCKGAGFSNDDGLYIEQAVETAKQADVIILALGEHPDMSGEAASRAFIELPQEQQKLADAIFKLGKPSVVVLFNGRPLDIREISQRADAVLEAWFPGTEGGSAIADILFGHRFPEGRLTMSFPYTVGQVPVYYNGFNTGRPIDCEWSEQRYLSRYIDIPNAPLYPFGYGLGFSKIEYCDLELSSVKLVDQIEVGITVKNIGKYGMTETVQLYIRDITGSVVRPIKELKKFKKVYLELGEARKVSFKINEDTLAFYHADGSYYAEPGRFKVFVGANSANTLEAEFIFNGV